MPLHTEAEQQNDCPYGCAGGAQPTSKDFN